jgi:DNA polymerase-1
MARTIIIDGDVVVYKVAEGIADSFEVATEEDDEYIYRNIGWANKEQAREYLENLIDKICTDCKGKEFVICLSDLKSNFRKVVNPKYKGNRKSIKPLLYDYLRQYLHESGYKIYEKPQLEADDVIGIIATSDKIIKGDKVVWSLDKDFKTIPCKFHRAKPNGKDESINVSVQEADWWFMYQTLIGDKVDGYDGCKGVGDKTARKLLGEVGEKTLAEMWKIVKETYINAGYTEEDALLNARMARILRAEDYDFKTKEVKLWEIK